MRANAMISDSSLPLPSSVSLPLISAEKKAQQKGFEMSVEPIGFDIMKKKQLKTR